jgi:O-antigen/teichoic acid export membrane protein
MTLRKRFAQVYQSAFVRSIMVLAGGTAIAQAISLLALPFITRLYTPADFSVFAVYVAIVHLLSVAACLRFEIAIPLPELDEDAANVLALALTSVVLVTSIAGMVVWLMPQVVIQLSAQPSLRPYLWLVPLGVFVAGAYSALQFWSIRKKTFSLIARTRVSQSVAAAAVQLGMGVAKLAPLGLLVGHLLQTGAGVFALARQVYVTDRSSIKSVTRQNMRRLWRQYQRFPKYSVGEVVAQTAGLQLPIIIIAALPIGPEAGFLSLAMKAMQAPISLVGLAVAQVFASAAPDAFRTNSLGVLTARTLGGLLKSAAGPMIFIGILAPQLFAVVFGSEWQRAGDLVRWMTPLFIVQMIASSLGTTLYVTGNQKLALMLQVVGVLVRAGSVLVVAGLAAGWVSETYAAFGALAALTFNDALLAIAFLVASCAAWELARRITR